MALPYSEAEVLKPLDPAQATEEFENDWPIFLLKNAVVRDASGELVSLLVTSADNPVTITGELKCKRKDEGYLQDRSRFRNRAIQIEVGPVSRYAYGDDGKGGHSVWAAGQAGWFLLDPAPQCQQIFDLMYNDIRAWYFVLDLVQSKSSQKDPLRIFADQNGLTIEAAQESFQRATGFILDNMTVNKEGLNWESQPVRKFIQSFQPQSPDTPVAPKGRRNQKSRGRSSAASSMQAPKLEDLSGAPMLVEELDRQRLGAAILWKFMQHAVDQQEVPSLKDLISKVHSEYQFENENQVRHYLFYQSQDLLKFMQERRNRKLWGTSKLFGELLQCSLSAQLKKKMSSITLRTRDYALNPVKVEYHTSSDEEPPDGHQSVSSLRPRSGKGLGKRRKTYRGTEVPPRDPDEMSSTVSTPAKRKFSETSHGPDLRRRLRVHSVDGETASHRESSAEPEEQPATAGLTLRWKRDADGPRASVFADGPLQVEANAPGDIWRCTVVGCVHAVYGASGKLGQELIEEHVGEHGGDDAPQVNLAVREMQKCKLPVSNLIKKIRQFAAAQELANASTGADDGGSPTYPTAIRRLVSQ